MKSTLKIVAIVGLVVASMYYAGFAGKTELHRAAFDGNEALVLSLIKQHPEQVDQATSWTRYTPLHAAAFEGRVGVVKLLLAAGADISARDRLGQTPLHVAVCSSGVKVRPSEYFDVCRLLIDSGADLSEKDGNFRTPLEEARALSAEPLIPLLENAEKAALKK